MYRPIPLVVQSKAYVAVLLSTVAGSNSSGGMDIGLCVGCVLCRWRCVCWMCDV